MNGQENWQKVKLGDITETSRSRVDPQEFQELPYIGLKHVEKESMNLLGTAKGADYKSRCLKFESGDILYGRLRPYLNKLYIPDFDGLCSAEFITLTTSENVNPEFLQYILNSKDFVSFADRESTGDRPRVKYSQISEYEFALPPKDTQKEIVIKLEEYLTKIENGLDGLELCENKLSTYRKSLYAEAARGSLTKDYREANNLDPLTEYRNPDIGNDGYEYSSTIDVTGELPDNWVWSTIGDVTRNYDSDRIPLNKSEREERDGKFRYFGASGCIDDIDDFLFDGKYLLISEDGKNLESRNHNVAFIVTGKFWANNHVHVVQTVDGILEEYLQIYIESINLRPYLSGIDQVKLNQGKMNEIPVPIPPTKEQIEINNHIEPALSNIENIKEEIADNLNRAKNLRDSVRRRVLEGSLDTDSEVSLQKQNSSVETKQTTLKDVN